MIAQDICIFLSDRSKKVSEVPHVAPFGGEMKAEYVAQLICKKSHY